MKLRPLRLRLSCILLLLIFGFSSCGFVQSSPVFDDSTALTRPGGRSLLSFPAPKYATEIDADVDGTVWLRDKNGRTLWTFATGAPICSSYKAPVNQDNDKENASELMNKFYVDCRNDWALYVYEHGFPNATRLPLTVEEFVKSMPQPYISEEGEVVLGNKKTTVFVLEAKTGKLVQTYSSDSLSTPPSDEQSSTLSNYEKGNNKLVKSEFTSTANNLLYITREDHTLRSYPAISNKVSWSMTVSEFGYTSICRNFENSLNTSNELGPESVSDFDMPFACQTKGIIKHFQTLDNSDYSARAHHDGSILPLPASNLAQIDGETKGPLALVTDPVISILPEADKLSDLNRDGKSHTVPALPPPKTIDSGIDGNDARMPNNDMSNTFSEWSTALCLILSVFVPVGFVIYRHAVVVIGQFLLNWHPSNSSSKNSASKRKKNRKSGKSSGSFEKKEHMSSESEDGHALIQDSNNPFMDLNRLVDDGVEGRRVGKLFVSNTEIAKGSNGTIVLEGIYEGRPVAVKRLVRVHHDVAFKEIQNLIASDRHPNIVRWYGVENDQDFVYLSLERCTCSLDDIIQVYSDSSYNSVFGEDQASKSMLENKLRLSSVKGNMQDLNLWKANGHPSPLLLKLMRDVVCGLVHLHELGIIHRDLKPQNVLIIKERSLCAKLSDMGISRRLLENMSSLGHHATGCGSSGWQAPEQLLHGRQTRAVDLFSLGCVLFFCITGGKHPFGDRLERDMNIAKNQMDLFLVECIPEAEDLISSLLNPDPQLRPSASKVLHHPLFWSSETRLSFLRDTSDRVELEDRETGSDLLKTLESIASIALGGKWDEKMEPVFINNIGRYRRYKFDSVRDLLRVMRNKLNHYRELPIEIQELVGPVPEGFDGYFASRFPRFLIEVYKVMCRFCREEECFQRYFKSDIV